MNFCTDQGGTQRMYIQLELEHGGWKLDQDQVTYLIIYKYVGADECDSNKSKIYVCVYDLELSGQKDKATQLQIPVQTVSTPGCRFSHRKILIPHYMMIH